MARTHDNGLHHICDGCAKDMHEPDPDDHFGYARWPRMDKKYCSPKCKQKAYRDRKAAAAEAIRAAARDKKAKAKARRFKKITSGSRRTKK